MREFEVLLVSKGGSETAALLEISAQKVELRARGGGSAVYASVPHGALVCMCRADRRTVGGPVDCLDVQLQGTATGAGVCDLRLRTGSSALVDAIVEAVVSADQEGAGAAPETAATLVQLPPDYMRPAEIFEEVMQTAKEAEGPAGAAGPLPAPPSAGATQLREMKGFLRKKGGWNKLFLQKRFFTLDGDRLSWSDSASGGNKGTAQVLSCTANGSTLHIELVHDLKSRVTRELRAESAQEAQRWAAAFKAS
mmetsp:Transcript_19790/g.64331  ORF Transcript_19790/g.64331 Transcript_19790/m.64331 type:complete len:252 (+) Transcript_19790:66-821(+)